MMQDDAKTHSTTKSRTDAFHRCCDDFEQRWLDGDEPDLAACLRNWDEPLLRHLFRELLIIDVRYRERNGERVTPEEYVRRFADHSVVVREVFAQLADCVHGEPGVTIDGFDKSPHSARADSITTETDDLDVNQVRLSNGRYQVRRLLGEGGFGRVYLAYDSELQRDVAIKVPRIDRLDSRERIDAYMNEARVAARLSHPSIAAVFDVGRTETGDCFVVSQFIDGMDLAETIRRDRPSHLKSAKIVALVAEGLHDAHAKKLIHRDIKPANILLNQAGQPFITDFGLALREEQFGKHGAYSGTPAYMSPEQARGEGHLVDGRCDIFSLGIVLYELLTGERPFFGETAKEVIERVRHVDARP